MHTASKHTLELLKLLKLSVQYMEQLASTANHFSPGKIHVEDFTEPLKKAIVKVTEGDKNEHY